MKWNWQLAHWPSFTYDPSAITPLEEQFLQATGSACAILRHLGSEESKQFLVDILSQEGLKSAQIEGEFLERVSLQSSIRKNFGFDGTKKKLPFKEQGMADLLFRVYESYEQPLTEEMLGLWHSLLLKDSPIECKGGYRTHAEPMQIVSNRYRETKVFFEAPPSNKVPQEMAAFIKWFNAQKEGGSILGQAALAHLYFESIHPFEDGNGRIGRALAEKLLSQRLKRPSLIAISQVIERRKKEYYERLGACNCSLEVTAWVKFFAEVVLEAQREALEKVEFLTCKSRLMSQLASQLNERQEKVLLRMFAEGPKGFSGGLSAENYLSITKTSRATATRDLSDLVEKGALYKTGELRHTRYWLKLS